MKNTQVTQLAAGTAFATLTVTNGTGVDVSAHEEALVFLNVTEITGTSPTFDVHLETSWDGTTYCDFPTAAAASSPVSYVFAQKIAAGTEMLRIGNFGKFVRAVYDLGGAGDPTVTFSVQFVGKRRQHG